MVGLVLLVGCFGLPALGIAVAVGVYFVLWLREKTLRDEMVLGLLGEIGEELKEIQKRMKAEG